MQKRGITMKSSSISLVHVPRRDDTASAPSGRAATAASGCGGADEAKETNGDAGATANGARPAGGRQAGVTVARQVEEGYLINLIDSPGHVDFCSEARHCTAALASVYGDAELAECMLARSLAYSLGPPSSKP
jgi:translation elongation factor EF-G